MEQLTKTGPLAALTKFWEGLTAAQKATVTAFAALGIVAVVIISVVASKPSKAILFSGLQSEDAGAIVGKLDELKVPYELSADGTAIKVPQKDVYDLRLKMATEGLPQGGSVGFEIFDKSNFGMTEFNQRLNYQRALQGELTRTIGQLAQVSNARIHIAIPEDKLYTDKKEDPTASVVLRLRPGVTLRDEQIAGIVHLVSASVEGLKPVNVTVVDTNGNVLSEGGSDSGTATARLNSVQTKLKRDYEINLQRDLQSMLDRVVGNGKSIVRVSADMNFDRKQVHSQIYEPLANDHGVLVSQEQTEEVYNGTGPRVGGVPGVPNNMRGPSIRTTMGNGDTYRRVESSSKYEITKRIEETESAPGNVEKLSVAVMLDEKVDNQQAAAIQQTVVAAAGISQDRGDVVTVQRVKFDNAEQEKEQAEMASAARTATYVGVGKSALAVILLIVFMLFLRSLFKQVKVHDDEQAVAPKNGDLHNEQITMPPVYTPIHAPSQVSAYDTAEPLSMDEISAGQKPASPDGMSKAEQIAKSRPEDVARLIRDWMSQK